MVVQNQRPSFERDLVRSRGIGKQLQPCGMQVPQMLNHAGMAPNRKARRAGCRQRSRRTMPHASGQGLTGRDPALIILPEQVRQSSAIKSISTRTFRGNFETSTVDRAGGCVTK
jgi:hypothetical protein